MENPRNAGFTLVELLIVVVILGILAGIVVPSMSTGSEQAKAEALRATLATTREALDRYRAQHDGLFPGYPVGGGAPNQIVMRDQLFDASKRDGSTAAPGTAGYPLGPYLRDALGTNAINGLQGTARMVGDAEAFPAPDNATGWIYKAATGEFRANSSGSTSDGKLYADF